MNRSYYTPAVIEADAKARDAKATTANRPQITTAYMMTDGVFTDIFRYVDPAASAHDAFESAALLNYARDRWAQDDPDGERRNLNGRRYTVIEYRALWNGIPVDDDGHAIH